VGAPLVVVVDELVEQGLELADGRRLAALGAEPAFEGLLEAFDLAAGGGVVGSGVLLDDAEAAEFGLEAVAAPLAAGEAGGEDHAVVGQRRRWWPVTLDRPMEHVHDRRPRDRLMGGDGQGVAGVVVQERQDLHVSPIGERVVGEVGLPALIRQLRREPDVGGFGSLGRLRTHQPLASQVAGDARP
jgi:hypothetical protein